jgi:hypothetical protein
MMDDTNPLTPPAPAITDAPAEQKPETPQAPQAPAAAPTAIVSEATIKFRSCRWRADPEAGEFCTHRDVLPFAGKEGFVPDSWCPDCAFYKLRRTPKKREWNPSY